MPLIPCPAHSCLKENPHPSSDYNLSSLLPIVWFSFFPWMFYGFFIKYSDILFNYSDSRILTLFCRWVCGREDLHHKKHCLTLSNGEPRIKRNTWWNDSSLCLSVGEWEEWNLHLPCHSSKSLFSSMDINCTNRYLIAKSFLNLNICAGPSDISEKFPIINHIFASHLDCLAPVCTLCTGAVYRRTVYSGL